MKNIRLFSKLLGFLILVSFIVWLIGISIFLLLHGWDPIEGDTYSRPSTNVLGTIIILGCAIIAMARRRYTDAKSPDAFAAWLNSKTPKRNPETDSDS